MSNQMTKQTFQNHLTTYMKNTIRITTWKQRVNKNIPLLLYLVYNDQQEKRPSLQKHILCQRALSGKSRQLNQQTPNQKPALKHKPKFWVKFFRSLLLKVLNAPKSKPEQHHRSQKRTLLAAYCSRLLDHTGNILLSAHSTLAFLLVIVGKYLICQHSAKI